MSLSYNEELWGAAVLINAGCSEDSFIDFRGWLMLQGKEVFYRALEDPDSLSEVVPPYEVDTFIPLDSRIGEAYYNLTGIEDLPPPKKQLKYVLKGKKWENFEELASWFPKLATRFYAIYGAMPPRHIFLHLDQF